MRLLMYAGLLIFAAITSFSAEAQVVMSDEELLDFVEDPYSIDFGGETGGGKFEDRTGDSYRAFLDGMVAQGEITSQQATEMMADYLRDRLRHLRSSDAL